MKKFNALLHDVTVINFLLVARLTTRYRLATALSLLAIVVSVAYFYFSQVTIHTKKVFFKVYAQEDSTGGKKKISDIVSDVATSFMNQNEVSAIISNYDFTFSLAQKMVDSPQFAKFDFNNPGTKGYRTHADIFESCETRECNIKVVQSILPSFYALDSEVGTGRFILTVTTRSALTTLSVVKNFKVALEETRYKTTVADYDEQINQTNDLIAKSRIEIEEKGGFVKIASSESMGAVIEQQNEKIRAIVQRLNIETDQFNYQQIRLKESGATASKNIDEKNKLEYENYTKISKRIEHLRQNIASINSTPPESRSATDAAILKQLKEELYKDELELKRLGKVKRNIAYDDSFINTQINNQTNFEFDYKVTSEKVKKLHKEYESAKKELDTLFEKKAELENELLALQPDLEYLKLMESKLVSLKMLKSAVKSDVAFDQFGNEVSSFKRNSLVQIIIFSGMLVAFILFIALIVIYLFDDRVYDEYEIKKCCDNLQVIGQAPTFE